MRYMRAAALVYVSIALFVGSAPAQATPSLLDALDTLVLKKDVHRQDRQAVAKAVQQVCSNLLLKVPALTAAENAWLEETMRSDRPTEAASSSELSKRTTRTSLSACVETSERIQHDMASRMEILTWTRLLSALLEPSLGHRLNDLHTRGQIDVTEAEIVNIRMLYRTGYVILQKIVEPALVREFQ